MRHITVRAGHIVRIIVSVGVLIWIFPDASFAQSPDDNQPSLMRSVLSYTKTEIAPTYGAMGIDDMHQASLSVAQTVPLGIDRSSLLLQSRISLVHGTIGLRTGPERDRELRWSAGLLDGDLYRAPIAVGLTVLEYNRIGPFNLEARWFDFRAGPAVRWESRWGAIEPRLVGSVGASSLRPGTTHFGSLGAPASKLSHALDAGYRGEFAARLNYWLTVSASAGQRILVTRGNVHINRAKFELQTVPWSSSLQLFARYEIKRLATGGSSDTGRFFYTGLRLSL